MMDNIVLIVMDTLSAFNLPLYGYDRDTAPFLTKLAEENALYVYAYSNAPWTIPSHASLFSGKIPSEHGSTTESTYFTEDSFVEQLQEDGYTTIGFSNNPPLATAGFDKGFDYWIGGDTIKLEYKGLEAFSTVLQREQEGQYDSKKEKYLDFLTQAVRERDISSVIEAAKFFYTEKLRSGNHNIVADDGAAATNALVRSKLEDVEEPFFLFINYMEPHELYGPPSDYSVPWLEDTAEAKARYREVARLAPPEGIGVDVGENLQEDIIGLYDASIRYLDQRIEELHDHISTEFGDTAFIITADHGENLGHHDRWGHLYGIWNRLIRVPLIIAGEDLPSTVIEQPVSLQDMSEFIVNGSDIESFGNEPITAEYAGAVGFFLDKEDLQQYGEYKQKVLKNKARCLVSRDGGAVRHSHLQDHAFRLLPDNPGEDIIPEHLPLYNDISPFTTEIDEINL